MARRGGFPTPALHLRTDRERAIWFDGYVRTYLERDLQDLASIGAPPASITVRSQNRLFIEKERCRG